MRRVAVHAVLSFAISHLYDRPQFVPAVKGQNLLLSHRIRRLFVAIAFLSLTAGIAGGSAVPVQAQAAIINDENAIQKAEQEITDAQKRLETLRKVVEGNVTDDSRLIDTKVSIDEVTRDLLATTVNLRPRLDEVKSRLDQLGEPPAEGQPAEDSSVTDERNKLTAQRLKINNLTGEAEDLSITANKLSNAITKIRRDLFTDRLLEHTDISPSLISDAAAAFTVEVSTLVRTVSSWFNFIWNYKRLSLASAVLLSIALALFLLAVEYRLFGRLIRRDPAIKEPAYTSRLSVAFWATILPALALAFFLVTSYFLLKTFNVLRMDIAPIVSATYSFIGLVAFVALISRAILAPRQPSWRLVSVSNSGARSLGVAILMMAIVNGLDYVAGSISEALGSPVVLTVMKSLISSAVVGLLVIYVSFLKPVAGEDGADSADSRDWPRWIVWALRLIGIGLLLASLSGYVGMARFLATQIIVTGAVIATMYIGMLSAREISAADRFGETRVGKYIEERFHLGSVSLDQVGLVAGLLSYLFVLAIGVPLILFSWGFQPRDIELWAFQIFNEISIGNIRISLFGIAGGVLLFAIGLVVTRWFQKWLDGSVMARSHVDAGVRNSVKTGVGYIGAAIAGVIGVSAAGINLSSLALVAGALSLGVGFGLQNIVSNFVSGLILLVERPFKVGDWIATGTTEGFVRKISVRATEVETFQRQTIIVPNSEFINASLGNWTHRNRLARIDVPIGVSYDSDPRQVIRILEEAGHAQEGVLSNPEPFVIFLGFGDSSLDFQLCIFVPDILDALNVKNGIRIEVFERFKKAGIEIPFPQRDVNLFMRENQVKEAVKTATAAAQRPMDKPEQHGIVETGDIPEDASGDGDKA